jgi:hypothetical protein
MPSTSSTSSSSEPTPGRPRRWPRAFALALAAIALLELGLALGSERYIEELPLIHREKLTRADEGAPVSILVLGDSVATSGVRPGELAAALPAGVEMYNFALPAVGPSGGEMVLRRYLASHEPPDLVALVYSPHTLIVHPRDYLVRYVYGPGEMLAELRRDKDLASALLWVGTRPSLVRHRAAIRTRLVAALLAVAPFLEGPVRELAVPGRSATDDHRFAWSYGPRASRNSELRSDLERERGWFYFRERAVPGEQLAPAQEFVMPSFVGDPSERGALVRILDLAAAAGIEVAVLPAPVPLGLAKSLRSGPGAVELETFWSELVMPHPRAHVVGDSMIVLPHPFFADVVHLNPKGAARYGSLVAPLLAEAFRAAAP